MNRGPAGYTGRAVTSALPVPGLVRQDTAETSRRIRYITEMTRNDVYVRVGYRLTGGETVVDSDREPVGSVCGPKLVPNDRHQVPKIVPLFLRQIEYALDVPSGENKGVTIGGRVHVGSGNRKIAADPDPIGAGVAERAIEIHGGLLERVPPESTATRSGRHQLRAHGGERT